jgi:hypothetical protein
LSRCWGTLFNEIVATSSLPRAARLAFRLVGGRGRPIAADNFAFFRFNGWIQAGKFARKSGSATGSISSSRRVNPTRRRPSSFASRSRPSLSLCCSSRARPRPHSNPPPSALADAGQLETLSETDDAALVDKAGSCPSGSRLEMRPSSRQSRSGQCSKSETISGRASSRSRS